MRVFETAAEYGGSGLARAVIGRLNRPAPHAAPRSPVVALPVLKRYVGKPAARRPHHDWVEPVGGPGVASSRTGANLALEIRVLGRVDALVDGRSLPLSGSKQRGVLAMLALRANRTVSADELIDGLWAERPPASAAKNVQFYVSQLRKALAGDDCGASIVTHGRGYELQLPEDAVDAARFEQLVERARRDADQGIVDGAATEALELWRGAPLADVSSEPFAPAEIRRLEELHMRALELAIDAELAAGRHDEVIGRLEALIAEHPLNERFHAQRMLALYRAGRGSEALGRISPGPPDADRRDRGRARARAATPPGADPRPGPGPRRATPARELPRQLEGGSPLLAGRERELRWLRRRWAQASEGRVGVALVWGPAGIGKTRLVAELAAEVQRAGAAVLYAGGGEVADAALASVAEAGGGPPTDAAGARLRRRRAAGGARGRRGARPRARGPTAHDLRPAPRRAGPARLRRPARERRRPAPAPRSAARGRDGRDRGALRAGRGRRDAAADADRRERRGAASHPPRGRRVGAGGGGRAARRDRRAGGRASAAACARPRPRLRAASSSCRAPASARAFYAVDEPADPSEPQVCPFRGLAPFDAAHAEYFFGRERLVAELVARLVGSTLLAVFGPSGSGKSSAVRAGLLPALAERGRPRLGALAPGGDAPGRASAGRALAHPRPRGARGGERGRPHPGSPTRSSGSAAGERLVLLRRSVRGGLLRLSRRGRARRRSSTLLVEGAGDPDQRLVVVLAIRADFYGRCAEHAELSTLVSANQVLVGPMRRDELRRAIELPARKGGLRVEPRLVSALVGDVAGEPGGLPLLSAALVELWQRRDGRTLRYAELRAQRRRRGGGRAPGRGRLSSA